MRRETLIIIIGIIFLALVWYLTSRKPVQQTPTTGLIPEATNAINKLGTSIQITSNDISNVFNALKGLIGLKSTQFSPDDIAGGSDPIDYQDYSNIA